jgi:hypothetical protein
MHLRLISAQGVIPRRTSPGARVKSISTDCETTASCARKENKDRETGAGERGD